MELSLDFLTMESLRQAGLNERIEMILEKIKEKKIIIVNAKFNQREEAALIEQTMKHVNKKFPGIEMCSLSHDELVSDRNWLARLRHQIINLLTGSDSGFTIIGPAKIIKEIKREPNRIRLLTK